LVKRFDPAWLKKHEEEMNVEYSGYPAFVKFIFVENE
jgi:hypothetical protein